MSPEDCAVRRSGHEIEAWDRRCGVPRGDDVGAREGLRNRGVVGADELENLASGQRVERARVKILVAAVPPRHRRIDRDALARPGELPNVVIEPAETGRLPIREVAPGGAESRRVDSVNAERAWRELAPRNHH